MRLMRLLFEQGLHFAHEAMQTPQDNIIGILTTSRSGWLATSSGSTSSSQLLVVVACCRYSSAVYTDLVPGFRVMQTSTKRSRHSELRSKKDSRIDVLIEEGNVERKKMNKSCDLNFKNARKIARFFSRMSRICCSKEKKGGFFYWFG